MKTVHPELLKSFHFDCQRFVAYGTLAQEMPPPSTESSLHVLSALHVEMKCWQAGLRPMNTRIYSKGNALHNAWTAMRVRGMSMAPDPANIMNEAGEIFKFILNTARLNGPDPVLDWDEIFTMADFTLKRAAVASTGNSDPAVLTTLGMRQKVWSILVKYFSCWHFTATAPPAGNLGLSVDWDRYVYALHAPLDRRILNALERLPVGTFLAKFIQNGNLRQTDGTLVPWSKLEDSTTWWAYQRLMRRFASVGFSADQAPSLGKYAPCEFADAVDKIPVEVLLESLEHMSHTDTARGELSTGDGGEQESDPVGLRETVLLLQSRVDALERRVAELTPPDSAPNRQEGQPIDATLPNSNGSVRLYGGQSIHLRQTTNSSYIKVLLGPHAGNNFALIGRNLKTLSLKERCARDFPDLWQSFLNLTPKPYSMNGSTPHGGVGYGGTADMTKAEAIKLFLSKGFSVVDETQLTHGKPTEYHPG